MKMRRIFKWMKEHQIVTVVLTAILAIPSTVATVLLTREHKQISCYVVEVSLLNTYFSERLGKKLEVRADGQALKTPYAATILLTNTGNATIVAPELLIIKSGNAELVSWSLADTRRVLREGAKGEIAGDRLKLQLPFLDPGDIAAVNILSQGADKPGIAVESATPGLRLVKEASEGSSRERWLAIIVVISTAWSTISIVVSLLAMGRRRRFALRANEAVKLLSESRSELNRITSRQEELLAESSSIRRELDAIKQSRAGEQAGPHKG